MVKGSGGTRTFSFAFIGAGYASMLMASHFDSVRGPLLPLIAGELGLDYAESGWFFAVGSLMATFVSIALVAALTRYSERAVMIILSAVGVGAAIAACFVSGFTSLLVLAGFIGANISGLGTIANVLVLEGTPTMHQAKALSGLHAVYGVGSIAASSLVGWTVRHDYHWSRLYSSTIAVFILYASFAFFRLDGNRRHAASPGRLKRPRGIQLFIVTMLSIYVVGEVTAGLWMVTYLVQVEGLKPGDATNYLTAFFLTLTIARVACFVFISPRYERLVLVLALAAPLLAFALAYTSLPWAFALMGLIGPFFPLCLARVSKRFPLEWRSVTLWSLLGISALVGLGNLSLGKLADFIGVRRAFLIPPTLLGIALLMLLFYLWQEQRESLKSPVNQ